MKIIKINDPIYGADIRIIVNCSQDELAIYLDKKMKCSDFEPNPTACGQQFTVVDSRLTWYIVWVEKFKWTIECQSTMNHELLHLALNILEARGVPIGAGDQSEPLAYYNEFLFRECWAKLKPKKKVGK
jgi:hypothetical protein